MAVRKVQTQIEMLGIATYKSDISSINASQKVLRAEMRALSEEYKNSGDSAAALSKKSDVLERQILTQKEKIEAVTRSLEHSANAYGEADNRTKGLRASLFDAEAALFKMENELDDNKKAMGAAGKATEETGDKLEELRTEGKGLGDVLDDVGDKLGIRVPESAKKAANGLGTVRVASAAAIAAIAALVAATVVAETKLADMTVEAAAFSDEMLTMSANTSISAETLQEWSYAAELIDVDLNTMTGSMEKMIRNMDGARKGTGAAAEAFDKLGISVTDAATGELRSAEEIFYACIDALGQMENSTERDAASMAIFGKSAQDLNSLIVQGSDTLREYGDEAHKVGAVLSDECLAALGAVDDAQQRLLQTQKAVSNQISAEYAPYMEKALTETADFILDIGDAFVESGAVDAFGELLVFATDLLEPLDKLADFSLPKVATVLSGIVGMVAWLKDAHNLIGGTVTFNPELVNTALGLNVSNGEYSEMQKFYQSTGWYARTENVAGNAYDPTTGLYSGNYFNASGTDNHPGGFSWVGENGPERVFLPAGTRIDSASESRQSSGDTWYVTINAADIRELNDIVWLAQNERRLGRMHG